MTDWNLLTHVWDGERQHVGVLVDGCDEYGASAVIVAEENLDR